MRDFESPGRSLVVARNGMAATSHPLSTLTAVNVLQAGGNALDAAVAACAVQCVVEPGSTGIGGDCFALIAPKGGADIVSFNGSGRAPAAATTEWYRAQGIARIERQSPHSVTVPGSIEAWSRLLADHGTMALGDLLAPAIGFARDGYAITPRVHRDWANQVALLAKDPNAARIFLPDRKAPAMGTIHRQSQLAETLQAVAEHGERAFYEGRIAADMVDYLRGLGGLHTLEDFAATRGEYVEPIRTRFRGYDIWECPPNGQGIIALMILNILSRFEAKGDPLDADRLHIEVEATRMALRGPRRVSRRSRPHARAGRLDAVGRARGRARRPHRPRPRDPGDAAPFAERASRHGLHLRRRQGPQRGQLHQLGVPQFRGRPRQSDHGRPVPQSRRELRRRSRPPQHHRAREAAAPHDHPRHGDARRACDHAVRGHGRSLPGDGARALRLQGAGLRPGSPDGDRSAAAVSTLRDERPGDGGGAAGQRRTGTRPARLPRSAPRPRPSAEPRRSGSDWEAGTLLGGSDPRKDGCALGY